MGEVTATGYVYGYGAVESGCFDKRNNFIYPAIVDCLVLIRKKNKIIRPSCINIKASGQYGHSQTKTFKYI